jgi:hypothetical protein
MLSMGLTWIYNLIFTNGEENDDYKFKRAKSLTPTPPCVVRADLFEADAVKETKVKVMMKRVVERSKARPAWR